MSLLAEVAGRADVPVEGVVRVVTRQPVSRRIEQRVLTVLDALEPDQLRALERLALAAAPQVLPVGAGHRGGQPPARSESVSIDPGRTVEVSGSNGSADLSEADRLTVRVGMLLEEVVQCVNELRRDNLADRQDRVDDLAVLVDLITTGWRGVDRRLGRIERTLARLDTVREPPQRVPIQAVPQPLAADRIIPAPVPAPAPPEPPAEESTPSRKRRALMALGTPLLFIAALAIALLTFEFLASSQDEPRLEPLSEGPPAQQAAPTTSLSSTTGGGTTTPPTGSTPGKTTATPTTAATTPSAPTTPTTSTTPRTATPPPTATSARTPTTPTTTAAAPRTATTTTPTRTATVAQAPVPNNPGFRPARVFAWPAVATATYYVVRFFRGGELVYQARPATPRLVLPEKFVFNPGSYRWSVRPGFGPRAQKRIGEAIINSTFVIES